MISAPFYSVQTADTLPNGIRFEDFGNNRKGFVIEASSDTDPRMITPRICVPQGETRSIRGSYLIQSDVQAIANGFEGISQDVQTFVRNGDSETPLRTYHNDVFRSGKPEKLITDQYSSFTMVNFIDQIPYTATAEFVAVSIGCRGSSGELQINSALLRNHYADHYVTVVQSSLWSGSFVRQSIIVPVNRQLITWNRYLDAHSVRITKNQEFRVNIEGFINSVTVLSNVGQRVGFSFLVIVKLRRLQDQGYDYRTYVVRDADSDGSFEMTDTSINVDQAYVAENAYDQVEMIAGLNIGTRTDISSMQVNHEGIRFTVVVGEPTSTGG